MSEVTTEMKNRDARGQKAMDKPVPAYARLFFDHLNSEFIALKSSITDYGVLNRLDEIYQKRLKHQLTWSDIYAFDLTLVDHRPAENLIRKAYDSRARYRSVAGQKEYDEYLASKPMDLAAVKIDRDEDPLDVVIERELRADIKYLLSKVYLYYALLPMREGLRDQMTKRAVVMTSMVVVVIGLALLINITVSLMFHGFNERSAVFITVLTVMLAGIVGGCVSMLQRIQSTPSEGDALFNLAALTSGWRGIMLAPVYGGIFAFLLFVLFASGVLKGVVFPTIVTPASLQAEEPAAASAANVPTPAVSPSSVQAAAAQESPPLTTTPTATPVGSTATPEVPRPEPPTPTPPPAATPSAARSRVLLIEEFLEGTGPASGVSYALLIVWSFLAGFAERLVPDTLNRLVQKNSGTQGGGAG